MVCITIMLPEGYKITGKAWRYPQLSAEHTTVIISHLDLLAFDNHQIIKADCPKFFLFFYTLWHNTGSPCISSYVCLWQIRTSGNQWGRFFWLSHGSPIRQNLLFLTNSAMHLFRLTVPYTPDVRNQLPAYLIII